MHVIKLMQLMGGNAPKMPAKVECRRIFSASKITPDETQTVSDIVTYRGLL